MLNIDINKDNEILIVSLNGRLDTNTASDLEEKIKENISGIEVLIFDLSSLSYISSAGLRILLLSQKIMNKQGKMIVKNVTETVSEIFSLTGFSEILKIE